MRKRKARADKTAAERYDRWAERARSAGKHRLTVWLPADAFEKLKALAQTRGLSLAQTAAKVILEHSQEAPAKPAPAPTTAKERAVSTNAAALSPETRALVLGWRAEGASWAECARRLDVQGIEPPRGGLWIQGRGQTNLGRYFRD